MTARGQLLQSSSHLHCVNVSTAALLLHSPLPLRLPNAVPAPATECRQVHITDARSGICAGLKAPIFIALVVVSLQCTGVFADAVVAASPPRLAASPPRRLAASLSVIQHHLFDHLCTVWPAAGAFWVQLLLCRDAVHAVSAPISAPLRRRCALSAQLRAHSGASPSELVGSNERECLGQPHALTASHASYTPHLSQRVATVCREVVLIAL